MEKKKKRVKKRTRLIALLSALAALVAGGIGTGAAFAAMAATRKSSSLAASASIPSKAKGSRSEEASASKGAVLAASDPLAFCQGGNASAYSYCQEKNTDAFNSSAQVNYLTYAPAQGQYTGWAGKTITASVTLGEGMQMPIALPIGLWNGSTFVNPNTLSPETLDEYMLNGDYMGNIGVVSQSAGNKWYSFLGGVAYNGEPDTSMSTFVKNNIGTISGDMLDDSINGDDLSLQSESVQYTFQNLCNDSDLLSDPYFAQMASLSTSQLSSTIDSLLFGQLGLYTGDEAYYGKDAPAGSPVAQDLSSLKSEGENLESTATVEEYQKGFEAYEAALKAGKSEADARTAYLDAISGTDASKDQPLLCLAAWNQNVGYDSLPSTELPYAQGSDVSGDTSNAFDGTHSGNNTYSYAYWGAGPSYIGTSDSSDSTLSMTVSSTATDFLASSYLLTSAANSGGIQLTAIYYPGQTSSFYSQDGGGVTIDIEPVPAQSCPANELTLKGSVLKGSDHKCAPALKGMGQYITFRSLGLTPDQVNPTSLPSGTTLSTSSPSQDGLYFKAVSQSGEPLKSVTMQLYPDKNSSYVNNWYWEGWIYTPIAPATNSAPSGVTSADWPYLGDTYWAGYYNNVTFTASSLSSQPGWFDFSGVAPGVYDAVILSGTTESGKTVSYGSYYDHPTIQITATSFTSPETLSAVSDPCGFVDPSEDEVVVGASNPSSSITQGAASPKSGTSDPYTATVGSENPFTYEAEAYMPFDLSEKNASGDAASSSPLTFTLSSLPEGETLNQGSVEVNGKSLSSLGITPSSSSSSGISFALSPKDISSIGSQGGTIDVSFTAYLDPSFTSPASPKFEFAYKAYSAANSGNSEEDLTPVSTNGPADNSVPSTVTTSADSSSTGLWFKDLNADGSASTGAKFIVQNSSGDYLEEDTSSGSFAGWTWVSSPSSALEFSQRNASALFSFGGLEDGTYTVTQVAWPTSVGTSASSQNTGEQNWPGVSPSQPAGGPDWAGYPGHLGGYAGYNGSFQVTLSYSSPESMATSADPAGLVDSSQDSIYAFAPVKMAPLVDGSLSSEAYQTQTVGIPFTEGWEGYLPMANTSPSASDGSDYASSLEVSLDENVNGLEMNDPSTSDIEVAGVPLSTLVENGASATSGPSPASSSVQVYTITLPYKALEYLEENGKNAAGESLSSSSNRLIIISFPAVMQTSFKNGGTLRQWMALGSGWWNQDAGSGWYVSSSPLYTNGPAGNSVPSSLSPSQNSSQTGIWFKSLWYNTTTPAPGSKYTVQNSSGEYLTPVTNSSGTFTGWSYSKTPYDFTERNASAVFSFGGLQDGSYTLTQLNPAKGATSSSLSFTSTLSYSSPQSLKAVKDSLNLLDSSKDTVWAIVVPSSLPFTGGKMALVISISAVALFGAGALFFILRKRRRA